MVIFFYYSKKLCTFALAKKIAGCGAVGSALRSGRRGRRFESCHPDSFVLLLSGTILVTLPA